MNECERCGSTDIITKSYGGASYNQCAKCGYAWYPSPDMKVVFADMALKHQKNSFGMRRK